MPERIRDTVAARTVFISYARADDVSVRRDVDLLRAGGVKVYLDVVDIAFGERWKDALHRALQRCERVIVFWSRAAALSEWVDREWRYALELGKKIVPTLLDATPLPTELTEFQALPRMPRPGAARRGGPGRAAAPEAVRASPVSGAPAMRRGGAIALGGGAAVLAVAGALTWTLVQAPDPRDRSPVAVTPLPPDRTKPPDAAAPALPAPPAAAASRRRPVDHAPSPAPSSTPASASLPASATSPVPSPVPAPVPSPPPASSPSPESAYPAAAAAPSSIAAIVVGLLLLAAVVAALLRRQSRRPAERVTPEAAAFIRAVFDS